MKFSIIIPIYNSENFLAQCIDSILVQNFSDFELILVNDGSLDNSLSICEKYSQADKRVTIINKKNGGSTSARKAGAYAAKGDYIICIDSDDFIEQNYFQSANAILNKFNCDIISFGFFECINNSKIKKKNITLKGLYIKEKYEEIKNNFLYSSSKKGINCGSLLYALWLCIIRRDIFVSSQINIDDKVVIGEDMICLAGVLYNSNSLYVTDECYYNYRVLDTSMMHKFSIVKFNHYENTIEELLIKNYVDKERISVFAFSSLFTQLKLLCFNSKNYKEYKKLLQYTYKCKNLWNLARSVKIRHKSLKDLVKLYLLKGNFFFFFIFIIKNKFNKDFFVFIF